MRLALVEKPMEYGMTHEQIKNFVVNSHVTKNRKLRQVLVEVEEETTIERRFSLTLSVRKLKSKDWKLVWKLQRMSLIVV